jgi:ubiquinone/menaquinone biosynthesis C-methylase UbiE
MPVLIPPEPEYREQLLREVASFNPASILEVGCGGGIFLRLATSLDVVLRGIDPDAESVRKLQSEGFSIQTGVAEALPYPDAAYDLVVFSYTAHHIGNWPAALTEALRVARLGVLVLDPWFDASIPSQSVALAFDRWCKAIDRSNGVVHTDCLDAAALLGTLVQSSGGHSVRYEYLLTMYELGVSYLQQAASEQLAKASHPELWEKELEEIVRSAHVHGVSDNGAILLVIAKRSDS